MLASVQFIALILLQKSNKAFPFLMHGHYLAWWLLKCAGYSARIAKIKNLGLLIMEFVLLFYDPPTGQNTTRQPEHINTRR